MVEAIIFGYLKLVFDSYTELPGMNQRITGGTHCLGGGDAALVTLEKTDGNFK